MDRKTKGLLAESKTICELIAIGFEIYRPFADNGPYDLLALKNDKIHKVSVKSSSVLNQNTVIVTLKTVSRRKENNVKVNKFDPQKNDILAIYVLPLDTVYLLDAKKINATCQLNFKITDYEKLIWNVG